MKYFAMPVCFKVPLVWYGTITSLTLSLFLFSCESKQFENQEALWEYLKDESNGYMQTKTVKGTTFSLVYRPTDLLVNQELTEPYDADQVDSLRKQFSKYLYFNLSMSKGNKELLSVAANSRDDFGAMVNQLAFGMGEKVHLYTSEHDTLELADYVYPRMYGMSRSTTMMFVYPRDNNLSASDRLNFSIEDLGLQTGDVKFKLDTDILNSEPELIFNKK